MDYPLSTMMVFLEDLTGGFRDEPEMDEEDEYEKRMAYFDRMNRLELLKAQVVEEDKDNG